MILFLAPMHAPEDDLIPAAPRRRAQPVQAQPSAPVDEYGIPENPFAPPPELRQPASRRSRAARHTAQPPEPAPPQPVQQQPSFAPAQPQQTFAPVQQSRPQQGPQFQPPVSPEIPDWLRIAQQNHPPMPRPQGPRVQAAPRQEERQEPPRRAVPQRPAYPYAQEEYPQTAYRRPAQPTGYAQPVQQAAYRGPAPAEAPIQRRLVQETYAAPAQDAWQVEADEEETRRELPAWVSKVPWLGLAAFACVLAAVILWIMGMNYDKQRTQVLDARAAQEAALLESYPLRYRDEIGVRANRYNLSPAFVAAIVMNESSFRPEVTASSGTEGDYARGLMQLRPSTAEWIHQKAGRSSAFAADDLFLPEANLEYGCWYLNYLSDLFYGDPVLVAAAYHAGQGEVRNWLNTAAYSPDGHSIAIEKIPFSDTRRYVTRVLDAYAAYLRIYYGG